MRTPIIAAALATAAACTSPLERQARTYAHDSLAVAQAERAGFAIPAPAVQEDLARARSAVSSDGTVLLPRAGVAANMVIRTGQTSIEVDSLERAVSQVRLLAGRTGGGVAHTTPRTGPNPPPAGPPPGENTPPPPRHRRAGRGRPRPSSRPSVKVPAR